MNMTNFCHKIGMRRVQRCVLTRNTCKIISIKGLPAPQIMVSSIAFTCIVNINGLNFSQNSTYENKTKKKVIIWIGGTLFVQFLFFQKICCFYYNQALCPNSQCSIFKEDGELTYTSIYKGTYSVKVAGQSTYLRPK